MTPTTQDVPARLKPFVHRLVKAARGDLVSLVHYGYDLEGDNGTGLHDLRLLLILEQAGTETLERIAPVFRKAWRELALDPFVVTRAELRRLADVFPVKLRWIQRHHVRLHGEDLMADVPVEREHLRLRVEQAFRNHLFRLRRRYLAACGDDRALRVTLATNAPALAMELEALAFLCGVETPDDLPLPTKVVGELRALEHGEEVPDASGLYARLLDLLAQAVEVADRVEC